MTDSEIAIKLLANADTAVNSAHRRHERAEADAEYQKLASKAWDDTHPDDGVGGFSGNPHRYQNGQAAVEKAMKELVEATEIQTFLRTRICALIK